MDFTAEGNIQLEMQRVTAFAEIFRYTVPKSYVIISGGKNTYASVQSRATLEEPAKGVKAKTIRIHPQKPSFSGEGIVFDGSL